MSVPLVNISLVGYSVSSKFFFPTRIYMQEPENTQLLPHNLSFESLKKLNEHGVEYWSARDLQPCLGYSEWRKFENTINKAITSCRQSGNDPDHHFVGADKMIAIGKQAERKVTEPTFASHRLKGSAL